MPEDLELSAEPRAVLGKKVARLRRRGLTPANIFGHNIPSQAVQLPTADLTHALRVAGGTHLLSLRVAGEAAPRMVLVRHVSRKPTTDQLLHVDLYQVSMTEKTTVEVPIVLVGSAPIAETEDVVILPQLTSIAVECLPGDIPEQLEADISTLTEAHSAIHVADLRLPPGVSTAVDPAEVVVGVTASAREMAEEAESEEQPAGGAAAAASAEET
jgi:large subunit ribosomal protein L25